MDAIKQLALCSLLLVTLAAALSAGDGDGGAPRWCPALFSKVGDRCLHFATYAAMSQGDAKELCYSINGVLASVLTPTELKEIVDYMNSQGLNEGNYWLDGSDAAHEGTWVTSNGEPIPLGTPFWYALYNHPTPDDPNGREDCLVMNKDEGYYFNDVPCDQENRLICEAFESRTGHTNATSAMVPAARSDCPQLYTPVGGLCLLFDIYHSMTWPEARDWCRGMDGELAAIEDIEDLRALYLHMDNEGFDNSLWIGATDSNHEGTWTWTNGKSVSMGTPFWGFVNDDKVQAPEGGTSQNCMYIVSSRRYYFHDISCTVNYNPICMAN